MTRRSWALFAAMCLIWGVPYLLIRVAVRDFAPGTLVFLRTGIGGLVLLPFALTRGGFGPVLRRWRPLLAFSVIEMAGPWLLLAEAEQHLSSSLTGLLIAAVPLVGVVAATALHSDDRGGGPVRYVGLMLGLVGVVVLLGLDLGTVHVGALAQVAVVVVGYAIAPVIMARYLSDLPSIPVVCASLLVVAIGYLPYALVRFPSSVSAEAAWSVLGLACCAPRWRSSCSSRSSPTSARPGRRSSPTSTRRSRCYWGCCCWMSDSRSASPSDFPWSCSGPCWPPVETSDRQASRSRLPSPKAQLPRRWPTRTRFELELGRLATPGCRCAQSSFPYSCWRVVTRR